MSGVAIITGAGSGIGRSVAHSLAARDYRLVLAGRRRQALDETAGFLQGVETLTIPTDVTDVASVDALLEATIARFARVDLLFNNAGVGAPAAPPDQIDPDQWRHVIDVNLTGAFLCTRAAFRVMKEQSPQGGRIINNGSVSAHSPRPGSAAYTASKHAITGLTKATSLDGRCFNIACGQIDIGNAATDMADRMSRGVEQADGSIRTEPVTDVAHIGEGVAYMASLPLDANVQFMTLMATTMPYIGRG
ncbi:SDR family oxidoreductase [Phenylobacterium montanum]|uniref:D-xylose 1-dehydrogenase n=1 Tax=Phenylobacterium montanum TaxID=2823693 RepID=A0A975IX43_9CAUL|nr:SDR family oxidoreductase [Caulobacter sp. S6]QUD90239.1 SDR family oxidoreductase [Caulobacter sp. S6]